MHIFVLLAAVIIGSWPSQVTIEKSKGSDAHLFLTTTSKTDSIRWDHAKGNCYSSQIAMIRIEPWRRDKDGRPYFPGIVTGLRPGHCDLWLKSGDGEVKIPVFVM